MFHTRIFWLDLSMDIGMIVMVIVAVIIGLLQRRKEMKKKS
jgi:hypothetical protein